MQIIYSLLALVMLFNTFAWVFPTLYLIAIIFKNPHLGIIVLLFWFIGNLLWTTKIYPVITLIPCVMMPLLKLMKDYKSKMMVALFTTCVSTTFHILVSLVAYNFTLNAFFYAFANPSIFAYISGFIIAYSIGVSGVMFLSGKERNNEQANLIANYISISFIIMMIINFFIPTMSIFYKFIILIICGLFPILLSTGRDVYKEYSNKRD